MLSESVSASHAFFRGSLLIGALALVFSTADERAESAKGAHPDDHGQANQRVLVAESGGNRVSLLRGLSSIKSWRDLKPSSLKLAKDDSLRCYQFDLANGSKASLLVAELERWRVVPAVNTPTAPTSETVRREGATAGVNGGYFNLSNGESTSYVIVGGRQMTEPRNNKALTGNQKLKPYLETIFNRSELRVLKDGSGGLTLQIARHNDAVPSGLTLIDSLQGGPRLLPDLSDQQEAFVRKDPDGKPADSIGCHRTAARTALGIDAELRHVLILCVAGKGQEEFSSGITLPELADLLKALGCSQALNLDGGTSTTMIVECAGSDHDGPARQPLAKMLVGRHPETRVKSVLLLKRAEP